MDIKNDNDFMLRRRDGRATRQHRTVSLRAVLIGLVATPLNAYWLTYTYWHFGYLIDRPSLIYYNCVLYLVGLVGVNALLRRWRPRWAFSTGELLTLYLMLSLATAWCGVDFLTDLPEAIHSWVSKSLPSLTIELSKEASSGSSTVIASSVS